MQGLCHSGIDLVPARFAFHGVIHSKVDADIKVSFSHLDMDGDEPEKQEPSFLRLLARYTRIYTIENRTETNMEPRRKSLCNTVEHLVLVVLGSVGT